MQIPLKKIAIAATIFLGIISGILIGGRISNGRKFLAIASKLPGDAGIPDDTRLSFATETDFPPDDLKSIDGEIVAIRQKLIGKRTGILIVALECLPCEEFLQEWNQIVTPKLRANTQEIVLISTLASAESDGLPPYLSGKIVFEIDRSQLEEKYHAVSFPSAFAVDETGKVISIQYGKRQGIDIEILKFLTTHDI